MIWLSIHIYYNGNLDFLLIKGIQPFINKINDMLEKWFFIRYSNDGQHIRLRLKINENQKIDIERKVKDYFEDFFQKNPITQRSSNKNTFTKEGLRFTNYEAEIERYGGKIGMEISELFFQYSSEIVLELIEEDSDYENKLVIAALINYNLGLIYFKDKKQLNTFFGKIASNWLNFNSQQLQLSESEIINQIKTIKNNSQSIIQPLLKTYFNNNKNRVDDDFSDWRQQNAIICQQISNNKSSTKPISKILESYIHMNNNRLGISNFDESLVSDLLVW